MFPLLRRFSNPTLFFWETTKRPETQHRLKTLFGAGLQQDGQVERDLGRTLGEMDFEDKGSVLPL